MCRERNFFFERTIGHFLSSTFKVWESKVSLLLWFVAQEPRYNDLFFRSSGCKVQAITSGRNCQYLSSLATNQKSKDTLLSQTLKVEEKKVTLVFWFVAQEPRYGLCIIFHVFPFDATLWKKGGLGGALPSNLGVWNFTWCLSSYRRMGKHTELNSNPTFGFFGPP